MRWTKGKKKSTAGPTVESSGSLGVIVRGPIGPAGSATVGRKRPPTTRALLHLAPGTIKTRPLPNHLFSNACPARETGHGFAAIHQQFLREVTGPAIRAGEITKSGTPLRDSTFQDITDRGNQCLVTDGRYPSCSPGRVAAGHGPLASGTGPSSSHRDTSVALSCYAAWG